MSSPTSGFVVRLPNWVGDVCMALPALERLRQAGHRLVLVGPRWAGDLLAGHGYVCLAPGRGIFATVRALAGYAGCRGLLLTNSLGSAVAFRLAGVAATGHARDGRSWLLDRAVPVRRLRHEVESFWRLAGHALAEDGSAVWRLGEPREESRPPQRLGLRLTASHHEQAAAALATAGISGSYAVVAPLAVGTVGGRSKVWPGWSACCAGLLARGIPVVACPGPGEEAATASALPGGILLPGLGLGAAAAVHARAVVVAANDSGPMHLAAAVDAPVLGVFGASDPGRTRPWGVRAACTGQVNQWPDPVTVEARLVSLMEGRR